MNMYILDLFNENMNGLNDVTKFNNLKYYKENDFNLDMAYVINNYLDNYKNYKEKEIRELIENECVDFTSLNILSGARFGNDNIEYISGIEKIIDNISEVYKL